MYARKYFFSVIFLMFSSVAYSMDNEQLRRLFVVIDLVAAQIPAAQPDSVQNNQSAPDQDHKHHQPKHEKRSRGKGKFIRNKK